MFKSWFFVSTVTVALGLWQASSGSSVELTGVNFTGLDSTSIDCSKLVKFQFSILNNSTFSLLGLTHGLRFYSPDGASFSIDSAYWDHSEINWVGIFDFNIRAQVFDGATEDTVGFDGLCATSGGLVPGPPRKAWVITALVNCTESGKTLCIDSSRYGVTLNEWLWSTTGGAVVPDWGGLIVSQYPLVATVLGAISILTAQTLIFLILPV